MFDPPLLRRRKKRRISNPPKRRISNPPYGAPQRLGNKSFLLLFFKKEESTFVFRKSKGLLFLRCGTIRTSQMIQRLTQQEP